MGSVYNDKIAGRQVKGSDVPADGDVYAWNDTTKVWEPVAGSTLGGGIAVEEGPLDGGVSVVDPATAINLDEDYFDVQMSADGLTAFVTLRASPATYGGFISFEGLTVAVDDDSSDISFAGLTAVASAT